MDPEYQEKHLNFVKNNNGSTIQDIVLAGLPLHLSTAAVCLGSQLPWDPVSPSFRAFHLVTTLVPPLLSLTVLADNSAVVNAGLGFLVLVFLLVIIVKKRSCKDIKRLWDLRLSEDDVVESITNYRSSMLLVTAISILAVDFPVFPRRFGKTETFGYGLMDLGVGGFVFAAGLTSPEGRGKESSLRQTVRSCLPLILLGLARLAVVSLSGYHSSVSEYGVHWNFFFTLFFVKVFGTLIVPCIPGGRSLWVYSVVLAVVYEGILSFGLVDWILSEAPRLNILSANREGISSTLGFLAVYLAGVSWAREIIQKPFTFATLANILHNLCLWSGLMWLNLTYSTTFFLPPSRRLCNYTFYTFVVAYNLSILTGFLIIEAGLVALAEWKSSSSTETGRKDKKNRFLINKKKYTDNEVVKSIVVCAPKCLRTPEIYQAISYNALPFFLLSNLLTGAVNILLPTVETDGCPAVLVLLAYLSILAAGSLVCHSRQIKLLKL